jgi:hypothetical protein
LSPLSPLSLPVLPPLSTITTIITVTNCRHSHYCPHHQCYFDVPESDLLSIWTIRESSRTFQKTRLCKPFVFKKWKPIHLCWKPAERVKGICVYRYVGVHVCEYVLCVCGHVCDGVVVWWCSEVCACPLVCGWAWCVRGVGGWVSFGQESPIVFDFTTCFGRVRK